MVKKTILASSIIATAIIVVSASMLTSRENTITANNEEFSDENELSGKQAWTKPELTVLDAEGIYDHHVIMNES